MSISGSLSFSFPYNEPHSLPCTGYRSALTSCHVRAILQHVSRITSVFQSLKFQPKALIPTKTTPIIKLVYPFIFHIKDKWSKKKFIEFIEISNEISAVSPIPGGPKLSTIYHAHIYNHIPPIITYIIGTINHLIHSRICSGQICKPNLHLISHA